MSVAPRYQLSGILTKAQGGGRLEFSSTPSEQLIASLASVVFTGPPGEDGASAYEIAVANGFSGTEQAWLDSLYGLPEADEFDDTDLAYIYFGWSSRNLILRQERNTGTSQTADLGAYSFPEAWDNRTSLIYN